MSFAIAVVAAGMAMNAALGSRAARKAAEAARLRGVLTKKAFDSSAAETLQAGEYDAFIARLKGQSDLGKIKAAQGASGLEGGEDALSQAALFTSMDVETIRMNARRAAWGLKEQGRLALVGAETEAARIRSQGRAATLGTLIGGAGDLALMYGQGPGKPPGEVGSSGYDYFRLPMGSATA